MAVAVTIAKTATSRLSLAVGASTSLALATGSVSDAKRTTLRRVPLASSATNPECNEFFGMISILNAMSFST
jgi:hypothetical protein